MGAPEQAAAEVRGGVRQERREQDVSHQRGTVQGQVTQQNGVRQRHSDPDDPKQRHRHRIGDVRALGPGEREGEYERERGDENEQNLERGPEVGRDNQRDR